MHGRAESPARPRRQALHRAVIVLLAAGALLLALDAGWVHAKGWLAQRLLQHSWQQRAQDGASAPWPGADTRAVALLQLPRLRVGQIVVAGDSGRSLAFGPGWAQASASPGDVGTTVISGHRDTHFTWLREVRPGDVLLLDGGHGPRRYRVTSTTIADSRRHRLPLDAADRLLLVTCWPFDAITTGGSGRYVVSADPCDDCSEPGHSAQAAAAGARWLEPAPPRAPSGFSHWR